MPGSDTAPARLSFTEKETEREMELRGLSLLPQTYGQVKMRREGVTAVG